MARYCSLVGAHTFASYGLDGHGLVALVTQGRDGEDARKENMFSLAVSLQSYAIVNS